MLSKDMNAPLFDRPMLRGRHGVSVCRAVAGVARRLIPASGAVAGGRARPTRENVKIRENQWVVCTVSKPTSKSLVRGAQVARAPKTGPGCSETMRPRTARIDPVAEGSAVHPARRA